MRISDWSSDVCSSDLFFSRDAGVYPATLHVSHADASTAGTCCAPLATAGSIHATSQMCPSGSAKLRLNMKPCSCTGLGSAMPPFTPAVSARRLTSSLLSQLIASMNSLLSLGGMGRVRSEEHTSEL